VVIDEVQRKPDLFSVLRVLADRTPLHACFLILGSASPELMRQSSESLAGRIETVAMSGFSMKEFGSSAQARHWLRGSFPLSFLARTEADSIVWRKNFIQTFLERDLPQWGTEYLQQHCCVSGQCWRITMGRLVMRRSPHVRSASASRL
jgi:predicted AAA+ superfamily ATPase